MKERISSEISDGVKKGKEYATKTARSAVGVAGSIATSIWGESTLVLSEGGRWVRRVVKPGIKHILATRRGFIR